MTRWIICCLLAIVSFTARADFEASVDRTRLVEGETLELTLESAAANRFSKPELSVLEEHFEIRDMRQLSMMAMLNGKNQPVTRWIVTLMPKRTGFVVIPPVALGTALTDPISLEVLSAAAAAQDPVADMAPVFIDSEVDVENPYVQAQVLLTLRVYHSVSLYDDSTLSGLTIAQARVESLGPPRHYERLINGVRHGVIEVRYAIFAQQSGALEIPSQLFSATILQPRDPTARFSARAGKLVQVRSPSIMLDVKPVPDDYPRGAPWLPAQDLTLTQQWQPDPGIDLVAGEPLTRTLTIQAQGLTASQLPTLHSVLNGADRNLRQYADQPKLDNDISEAGVIGLRQDSAALVAQQDGTFALPALDVHWWDTTQDRLRTARLDAVVLNVRNDDSYAPTDVTEVPAATRNEEASPLLWPWQLACLLLSLGLMASLVSLHRARQRLLMLDVPEEEESLDDDVPDNPLGDLQAACRANHPAEARKALEVWARQQDSEGLIGLTHHYPELAEALDDLNACLFGQLDTPWRGKPLWRAVRMVMQSRKRASEAPAEQLASLYPDV